MKHIWIFGHSVCIPFNLKDKTAGWDHIIGKQLGLPVKNYAVESSDNFFIHSTIQEHTQDFGSDDIILVGWSHPSRKTFVYDGTNQKQKNILEDSIILNTKHATYIRSKSSKETVSLNKWFSMSPKDKGIGYYDTWFKDYYNIREQKINFQSYLYSTSFTLKNNLYFPFYFSMESVEDIDISKNDNIGFVAEFIKDNKVSISDQDAHFNEQGHRLWAKNVIQKINKYV
jgi:lysophospholipase L1-like esterase